MNMWAFLTIVAFVLVVVFATVASLFVAGLARRTPLPIKDEVGSVPRALRKLRKREPMSDDEMALAKRVVNDRGSVPALCIPATIFCIGCFYVFGSLQQLHGATPSERTFLGVIPMLMATNMTIRLLKSASLKRRLRKMR